MMFREAGVNLSGRASTKAGCQTSGLQFNCPWEGQNLWALVSPTYKIQSCGHRSFTLPFPSSIAHHLSLHFTLLLHMPSFPVYERNPTPPRAARFRPGPAGLPAGSQPYWRPPGVTSLAPHERLPEILVVPREKTPTGAAARGNP